MNIKLKRKGQKGARRIEDVIVSSIAPCKLSQDVCIRTQRRTLNDTACSLPRISGLFLDAWPLSHYTAGKVLARRKGKENVLITFNVM